MDGLVANKDLGVNHMVSFDWSEMSDSQIYDAAPKKIRWKHLIASFKMPCDYCNLWKKKVK